MCPYMYMYPRLGTTALTEVIKASRHCVTAALDFRMFDVAKFVFHAQECLLCCSRTGSCAFSSGQSSATGASTKILLVGWWEISCGCEEASSQCS